jgi:hypothetical protein
MSKLHDLYLKKSHQKPNQETDLVRYDDHGNIKQWSVYSEYLNEWFDINLKEVQWSMPSTYNDVQDKVNQDLIYRNHALEETIPNLMAEINKDEIA